MKETILILGATSDVGIALAELYASKGHPLQLAARNLELLEPIKSDLEIRYGIPIHTILFNALEPDSFSAIFKNNTPIPDIAIQVFGWLGDRHQQMNENQLLLNTIMVNYSAAAAILATLMNKMAERGYGTIVGISSVAGERGRQSNFIYGSAKAGLSTFLEGLRNYGYKRGVHVLTVKPGFMNTAMTAEMPLPKILTAEPEYVAKQIYKAILKKKNTIYTLPIWRLIMWIIKNIPEFIFKKLNM
jgi:decaprenylphospho-beta-D-erythro-pentofuranosid-2-ulose 2-reductase